jgi:hypothetical protein
MEVGRVWQLERRNDKREPSSPVTCEVSRQLNARRWRIEGDGFLHPVRLIATTIGTTFCSIGARSGELKRRERLDGCP